MSIEIQHLNKTFNQFAVLKDINLQVPKGELVALLGPSGCGKTTLLRIIAGLEVPDSGLILFHGEDTTSRHVRDRHVGFVFQHYALFRHMTVFENVAFGLRVCPRKLRPSNAEIRAKVHDLLYLVQMRELAERYPNQLSGGQRQRVALIRALAVEPKVLLLDEPFGALDTNVRKELRRWLRHLHDTMHVTSVFVTHDQEEAMEVADRVVVMNEGHIEQVGTPEELYENAANPFVYRFLGSVNLFHGRVQTGHIRLGDLDVKFHEHAEVHQAPIVAYVRPHELEISREADQNTMVATVSNIYMLGSIVRLELVQVSNSEIIEVELTKEQYRLLKLHKGEQVFVKARKMRLFMESNRTS
ncbi:sulfate ABC transporter, ATP-binding protein [Thioploca ingrica]|uniref:Sulfate ABC transporter, ATP-binding protein n=1 Tax=Thioploca ingrica TaxID=40754 RepID=A0A090AM10_9GAMM|nr:sulfate ABC transporter, ATP-binding protein [Thioploca ingrica]